MGINKIKALNRKKPFYYHDINYIKNHNKDTAKTKIETKAITKK